MDTLVARTALPLLTELSEHLRIVMVGGPRQAGKSTLLRQYTSEHGGHYRSLDQDVTLRAAEDDPMAFVSIGETPRVIDEVQLGGDRLVRAIKVVVDTDPRPGRFILSGSSRFLTIPTLSESLAGRIVFVDLWPLSMRERTGASADPMVAIFGEPMDLRGESAWTRTEYLEAVVAGGYPEALGLGSRSARKLWYDGYVNTVVTRDIATFAAVSHADAIAKLLNLTAARAGSLQVVSDLAQSVELSRETTKNYLSYLDMVYLTTSLPAWSTNLTARLVKSPKAYPTDSGLAAHLLGVGTEDLMEPGHPALGPLVETFVATELLKAVTATDQRVRMYHVRSGDKNEVDFILEGPRGRLVAIEVKASSSPGASALKGLRWLKRQLGDRLHAGILLHLGSEGTSNGDGIFSLPLSTLWGHRKLP